jgi:single-stranded-DNA-specific exonuclease
VRPDVAFNIAPYDFAAAERLSRALGVSPVLAQILVRRGLASPEAAERFLAAEDRHSLDDFAGLREAAERILEHVGRGSRITVHGDYDVDGVCSTAILVRALRTLGAEVDWYLPSRIDDGYGLAAATVEKLAARGTELLVTVDCAITAVDEVAAAVAAGMDVVVTDHHAPRADGVLPGVTIVHPRLGGGYPCEDLCAAGVAHKLAAALLEAAGEDPGQADEDLDLVALATVADVVPLLGENRRLVRDGLRVLASTRKPGLRALMDVAKVDPSAVDAGTIGFRLAPRINAAGRLYRADAGLELLLTADVARARQIAEELDRVNSERRDVETRIRFEAEAMVAEAGPAAAYVLAGEGWHPGVIGIVAARIAERHHRPAVLIAMDGEEGTGSGRSIPGFDLLAGFHAGARHLQRYGGHRAAAGLSVARADVDAFREAFVAHAAETLTPEDLIPRERIDAVVPGDALTLGLAEEFERLAPFGSGNPAVNLLVPAAHLTDPRPLSEGRHVAFTLTAGGAPSRAVCFGAGSRLPAEPHEPVEAAVRLEVNRYNGSVEPRLILRHARPAADRAIEVLGEPAGLAEGIATELERELTAPSPAGQLAPAAADRVRDVRGRGIAGVIADLVATGDPVLVVTAHARVRAASLRGRIGGFSLVEWAALQDMPALADPYVHVVALDPPVLEGQQLALRAAAPEWTHLAWGPDELDLARRIHEWNFALRAPLRAMYQALRAGGPCEAALRGDGREPRSPALAGRLVRVLTELALVEGDPLDLRVTPAPQRTELERSAAFRAYEQRLQEGLGWLSRESSPQRAAA